VPDAIYFKDARGRFIRMNQGMAKRLGLADAREAVGRTVFELPNQSVALDLHQHDEEVMRTGELQAYKLEKRVAPDGTDEWDLVTRLPLLDAVERVVGIIVIYRNVTEQKRAEAKTEEAVRRRDQFLAMLSHELRNPLGAVVTATGLLRSGSPSAKKDPDRLLDVLERQSQQMARLLDDLLEASRVTQNKIELRKTIVDLRIVIRDTVDALRSQVDARALALNIEVPDEPLYVLGDPARLQQIHANLLNNAAKYTPRGGKISIEAKRLDGHALVQVRDNGVGIPKEMLDSVFELFVQSNRSLERAAGGLGVGLTLVRSLVAMHGGEVSAKSDGEGKGSDFTMKMPLATDVPPIEIAPPTPRTRVPSGARVVIVEDNKDSREMLCEALDHAGFECHTAGNGLEAIALIDKVRPDIAILDVGLPGIDGFEIARRVRANPRHANICLIALTGYGQASDRITSREAGFDEHLVKPARAETLLGLISDMRNTDSRARPLELPVGRTADRATPPE
jgi:two-component system CheB/CheR fusion protein